MSISLVTIGGVVNYPAETKTTPTGQLVTTFKLGIKSYKSDAWDNYKVEMWGEQGAKLGQKIVKGTKLTVNAGKKYISVFKNKEGVEQQTQMVSADPFLIDIAYTPSTESVGDGGIALGELPI